MIRIRTYVYQVRKISFSEKCDKNKRKIKEQNLSDFQEQQSSLNSRPISTKRFEIKYSKCNNFQS